MSGFLKENTPLLCVLGLGSNRPYKGFSCTDLVHAAVEEIQKTLVCTRLSPLYRTEPLYVPDQAPFINAAVSGFFSMGKANSKPESVQAAAWELLALTQAIEAQFGRDRKKERRWGERTLDIDILLFGDLFIKEKDLSIPHPRLKERAFALRPLLDLLPDAAEPGTGEKYSSILKGLSGQELYPV